ncbi:MAG: hypothetical protein ACFE8A_02455 [Candidatus Hodarchaeota archaeon]
MALDVEKELKIFWIAGIIVLIIFGLWWFISPESSGAAFNWPFWDPQSTRGVGGLYLTWAIVVITLYKDLDNWDKIESWVLFGIIAQIFSIINNIIGLVLYNIPIGAFLLSVIINVFFTILGIHIWIQKRK